VERLNVVIAAFDADVADEMASDSGERADLWTDVDIHINLVRKAASELTRMAGELREAREQRDERPNIPGGWIAVTVGGGLSVYGTSEAIHRVQGFSRAACRCLDCGLRIWGSTEAEAIAAWNTRSGQGEAVAWQWRLRDRVMKHEDGWSYVDYFNGLKIAEFPEKYETRALYLALATPSAPAVLKPEWKHDRDCAYVTSDGPAPCTCSAADRAATPAPPEQPEADHFLTAYASKDGRVTGIDHDTNASWSDVLTAHVALRDWLTERIEKQGVCPFRPAPPEQESAKMVERFEKVVSDVLDMALYLRNCPTERIKYYQSAANRLSDFRDTALNEVSRTRRTNKRLKVELDDARKERDEILAISEARASTLAAEVERLTGERDELAQLYKALTDLSEHNYAAASRRAETAGSALSAATAEVERLRLALRIIAGKEQCMDNLMSNADVALAALGREGEGK
jgi:hypothetical protein